ncbi:hypothetical protein VTN02DRAFT_1791 [Thermoascus thermophilus]
MWSSSRFSTCNIFFLVFFFLVFISSNCKSMSAESSVLAPEQPPSLLSSPADHALVSLSTSACKQKTGQPDLERKEGRERPWGSRVDTPIHTSFPSHPRDIHLSSMNGAEREREQWAVVEPCRSRRPSANDPSASNHHATGLNKSSPTVLTSGQGGFGETADVEKRFRKNSVH